MQIKIHYPIFAKGVPKGRSVEREIYGSFFEFFDIAESGETMSPYLTVGAHSYKGHQQKEINYVLGQDGTCYRRFHLDHSAGIPTIHAVYGDHNNPVCSTALVKHAEIFKRNDLEKTHFPPDILAGFRHQHLLTPIDNKIIKDLEVKDRSWEMDALKAAVNDLVVIGDHLYKRAPEPVYAVIVDSNKRVLAMRWIATGFPELDTMIAEEWGAFSRDKREVVGLFALSDQDRMLDYAKEITAKIGGTNCANRDDDTPYEAFGNTLAGSSYNLKVVANRMKTSAVESITAGGNYSEDAYASRLLSWDGQTLELFRQLEAAQSAATWPHNMEALERIVSECFAHDASASRSIFTNAHPKSGDLVFENYFENVMQEYHLSAVLGDSLTI